MENRESLIAESFTVPHIRKVVSNLIRKPLFASQERDDLQQDMLMYVWSKQHQFCEQRANAEAFVTMLVTSCVRMMIRARRRGKRLACRDTLSIEALSVPGSLTSDRSRAESPDWLSEAHDQRRSHVVTDVAMRVHKSQIATLTKAQVPAEHQRFLIDVAERGVSGAAKLHGISRRRAHTALLSIGHTLISRAATSAAA